MADVPKVCELRSVWAYGFTIYGNNGNDPYTNVIMFQLEASYDTIKENQELPRTNKVLRILTCF